MSTEDFNLTPTEIIFLIVAILVTVPMLIFLRWVLKELRAEKLRETENQPGPGKIGPGGN